MVKFLNSLRQPLVVAALGFLLSISARAANSVSHYGITWTFSSDRPTGTFVNGEPWVVGPVTITHISPNPTQSVNGVQHGSMINPIPNTTFGFDSHPQITSSITYEAAKNVALSFPFNLKVGDVLVSANSQLIYPTYLKTVAALTVLGSPPATGSFRPSIFGTDRSVKWNVSQLNWSVLKNYAPVAATPSKAVIESQLPALPWFEWAGIWSGNSLQPTDNTADGDKQYGRETAGKFGQVGLWLNTNQPLADKQKAAIQLVQNGLDIYAYVKFGGGFYHDGGHKCGRKLPLVVAAMMLNDPDLKGMAANPDIFQEDMQTFFVKQSDVGRVVEAGQETYRQEDVGMAEWGIRHRWEPIQDDRSLNARYRTVVGPGMMGPWLAGYLMGAQTVWNHAPAFAYMERYHALLGDGAVFTQQMYAAHKSGTVTPPAQTAISPIISPSSGYFDSPQQVAMATSTPSATIRYTFNGATPGSSDTVYSGPITISSSKVIKAIAYASGMDPSGVTTAELTFSATPPSFSPAPGGYTDSQSVTLSTSTVGATIRYTTDGSAPTANSPVYTGPIAVTASTTIKAISTKSGIEPSPVSTGIYGIGAFVGSQTWVSTGFDAKSAQFTYGFDMAASAANIDAVVGLGGVAPVTGYEHLACIVRFNVNGKIDARNGGGYSAIAELPYSPGNVYSVKMTVDPVSKTYGVTVAVNGGTPVTIAQNFAFRAEQATLSTFNRMALLALVGNQTVMNYGLQAEGPSKPTGLRVVK